ncbi:MAG: patatin-like phospholipase family protein [Cyanobacteria bacterium SZAS TMP-1]|nr:patatin-like phospholipase family protein [Cyanobacteria bacterium SZAS TMP-1]
MRPRALLAATLVAALPLCFCSFPVFAEGASRDAQALSPPTTATAATRRTFGDKAGPARVVLALSGGGCKAAAQIGVLRSLEQHHIPIDGIVGTSMGSTIGALYCAGMSVDDLERVFIEKEVQKSLLARVVLSYCLRPLKPLKHLIFGKPYAGLSDGAGYLKFLRKNLPPTFADLKIPFAAVATNLTDGQTCVLAEGDLPLSVLASNAVPTLIRPVMIKNKLYVDGGLRANLPANIAQSLTSGLVVSVLVDTAIKPEKNAKFKSRNNLVMRVADIVLATSDKRLADSSDILIYPNVDFVPGFTKDPEILKKGIAAGQSAADMMLPKIEQALIAQGKVRSGLKTSQAVVLPLEDIDHGH